MAVRVRLSALGWVLAVLLIPATELAPRADACAGGWYNYGWLVRYDCFTSYNCSVGDDWCEHDTCSCPDANLLYCVGYYYCGVYSGCINRLCMTGTQVSPTPAQTSRTPFTVVVLSRTFDADGKQRASQVHRVAIRSDGSRVDLRELINAEKVGVRVVWDVKRRTRVAVDPLTQSKTTYKMTDLEIERLQGVTDRMCGATEPVKRKMSLGYETFLVTTNRTVRQDSGSTALIRVDEWRAPALQCFSLGEISYMIVDGKVASRTDTETTSISVGEPDSSLFEIPATYAERRPSEVFHELSRRRGQAGASSPQCLRTASKLDEAYASYQ